MRSLHIDHGSPMNALAKNTFTEAIKNLGDELQGIKIIFILSAHWSNSGTHRIIGSNPHPGMIYDMYGFPPELYRVQYPVSLDTQTSEELGKTLDRSGLSYAFDPERGIDHGVWSVLIHMFPQATLPIVPISVPYDMSIPEHYQFGSILADAFPGDEYLLVSSGNIVHNLRLLDWTGGIVPGWASDFDSGIEKITRSERYEDIFDSLKIPGASIAVPTPDHFFPFVSFLGASQGKKIISIHRGFELGSISQRIYKNF